MRLLAGLIVALATYGCASTPAPQERFSFVALMVTDVDASSAWYARTFNLREANRLSGDSYDIRILASDELMVELIELNPLPSAPPEDALGISKAGFEVADWEARIAAWRAAGVRFHNDRVLFDESLQLHYVLMEDPDGNLIQVFARAQR